MPTLDEQQGATAEELVLQVMDLKPDQGALWQLNGAVGSGKTTVLRQVAEQLRLEEWIPLFITAPAGEIDSAPIALLETARQLKSSGGDKGSFLDLDVLRVVWVRQCRAIANNLNIKLCVYNYEYPLIGARKGGADA